MKNNHMKFKSVRIPSIKDEVFVREDGVIIRYQDRDVHFTLVKGKRHKIGYHQVSIEGKRMYVHQLVAEAYVINKHPLLHKFIIHKDFNSLNNHYKNLKWGDRKMIVEHRKKKGQLFPENYRGSSTISHEEALKIVKRLEQGEFAKDICIEYGVSEMSIARIRKRYLGKPASKRFPKNVKKIALKLLETHTASELVPVTGITYHTLYRWNKELLKNKEQ